MENFMEDFPQPISVYSLFGVFHEVHSSAVFWTHYNKKNNAQSSTSIGMGFPSTIICREFIFVFHFPLLCNE